MKNHINLTIKNARRCCIGKQLVDYPFKCYEDTELYKLFFKHDKRDDYKNIFNILLILKIIKHINNMILQKVVKQI